MDEKLEAQYRKEMGRAMALFDNPTDDTCIAASVGFSTACSVLNIHPGVAARKLKEYVARTPPGVVPPPPSQAVARGYDLQTEAFEAALRESLN